MLLQTVAKFRTVKTKTPTVDRASFGTEAQRRARVHECVCQAVCRWELCTGGVEGCSSAEVRSHNSKKSARPYSTHVHTRARCNSKLPKQRRVHRQLARAREHTYHKKATARGVRAEVGMTEVFATVGAPKNFVSLGWRETPLQAQGRLCVHS
jgi:hypothetical protein